MTKIEKYTLTEDILNILRLLSSGSDLSQRDVSARLEISLGKTNYLLKSLIKKNLIKAMNFSRNRGKLGKVRYILTKKGLEEKINLMYHFLKKKEAEYNRIREELNRLQEPLSVENQQPKSERELSYQLKGESNESK